MSDGFRLDAVDDPELLWRRIHGSQYVSDGQGGMRVSSGAFADSRMSVDRAVIVRSLGLDHAFTRQSGAGVAQVTAAFARSLDQQVLPDKLDENPAHALVIGDKKRGKRRVARRFAEEAEFLL